MVYCLSVIKVLDAAGLYFVVVGHNNNNPEYLKSLPIKGRLY